MMCPSMTCVRTWGLTTALGVVVGTPSPASPSPPEKLPSGLLPLADNGFIPAEGGRLLVGVVVLPVIAVALMVVSWLGGPLISLVRVGGSRACCCCCCWWCCNEGELAGSGGSVGGGVAPFALLLVR